MTLWLWMLSAGLAAAGTRLTGATLAATAVVSLVAGGARGSASAVAAITAACLLGLGRAPRRLAAPAVGAAAVLVAASAPNLAAVLPAWTVASVAALANVYAIRSSPAARRWALSLAAGDLVLAAGVTSLAVVRGFASWDARMPGPVLVLVAGSALARARLAAGPAERVSEPGLVLVRLQTAVLLTVVLGGAQGPAWFAQTVLLAGAALFAAGPLSAREAVRDAVQDTGLVAAALAASSLDALSSPWVFATMAAGAAIHVTRLVDPRGDPVGRTARKVAAAAFVCSPAAGVALAVASGTASLQGAAPVSALLLVTGVAGRVCASPTERREGASRRAGLVAGAVCVAAGTSAAVLAPRSLLEPSVVLTGLLVLAGAFAGARFAPQVVPPRPRRLPRGPAGRMGAAAETLGSPLRAAVVPWVVPAAVLTSGFTALVLIVAGFARGFL